ncbi:unnamed protein product [Paramecium sonneborni]|uniref:Uncharacterized protein n=1 Tax=Paramecium sonneborni TaxID=65129 RepID=A0A8S1N3Q6_9CILI|nr:unnamed protein product [Paramecium sonneborni]
MEKIIIKNINTTLYFKNEIKIKKNRKIFNQSTIKSIIKGKLQLFFKFFGLGYDDQILEIRYYCKCGAAYIFYN